MRVFGRNTSIVDLIKVGMREWPEVYASTAVFILGACSAVNYFWLQEVTNDQAAVRYKHVYMICRPDDPRLDIYPAQFLTDKKYLREDHPKTIRDLKQRHLTPTYVHVDKAS